MALSTDLAILPFKVMELARIIAEKKKLSIDDALFYLYNSRLYRDLPNPDMKLWYLSGVRLYNMLLEEKLCDRKRGYDRSEEQFLIFCVERYRLRENMSSATVLAMFIQLGVTNFLRDHFDVLHTQGDYYILHEIDMFVKNRK